MNHDDFAKGLSLKYDQSSGLKIHFWSRLHSEILYPIDVLYEKVRQTDLKNAYVDFTVELWSWLLHSAQCGNYGNSLTHFWQNFRESNGFTK